MGRVDLGGCPPKCRVAREHCCSPAPSERHVNLSVYAAQASPKAPRGTRWGTAHHLHDTGLGLTGVTRRRPHQQQAAVICSVPRSQLFRRSRAETPEGSQPAFAWDDFARGLNPYPLGYRAAFASSLILYPPSHRQPPCGGPTPRGGRRAYHVLRMNHGWFRLCLSAGGPTATAGEGRTPCTWPRTFWFKPLSAFGLLDLTTFISSSLELAMPSTLAPNRLGVSSRRALSREARPPWVGEVTLSQELRTARLPRPHVLVGYQWSHMGYVLVVRPVITGTSVASCRTPHRSGLAHHAHPVPHLMNSRPARSVVGTWTWFRSRCTCQVSLQRLMRRHPLPLTGFLGLVPPLPRYYEVLRLPAAHFAALRFLRLAIPSLRPWFVPPGPGRGAVDQSGVGRRYLQPPGSMETTGSPKFPEEPL